jgi:hypothetical protein
MSYDDALLLSNRTPDMSRTAFTGDQIEMLNRLLDENNVTLTKKD